jgi:hypothetical protein
VSSVDGVHKLHFKRLWANMVKLLKN